jgi:hypothetical protein
MQGAQVETPDCSGILLFYWSFLRGVVEKADDARGVLWSKRGEMHGKRGQKLSLRRG